jgi:hypothetical protein
MIFHNSYFLTFYYHTKLLIRFHFKKDIITFTFDYGIMYSLSISIIFLRLPIICSFAFEK